MSAKDIRHAKHARHSRERVEADGVTSASPRKNALLALAINIVVLLVCLALCPMSETGDDEVIMAISSGCFGEPSGHLVFINACLAYPIMLLNTYLPMVNWYYLLQFAFVFLALMAFSYICFDNLGLFCGFFLAIGVVLLYGYEAYVAFQFTKTAGVLSATGVFLLLNNLYRRKGKRWYAFGIVLMALGFCYRFMLALAATCLMIVIAFVVYLVDSKLGDRRRSFRKGGRVRLKGGVSRCVSVLACVIAAVFVLYGVNSFAYSAPEWQDFNDYNYWRGYIRDYPIYKYDDCIDQYRQLGMSRAEYDNMTIWNIADPEVYTTDLFEQVSNISSTNGETARFGIASVKGYLKYLVKTFARTSGFILFALISITLLVLATNRKKMLLRCVIVVLGVLALSSFMYLRGRYGINRVDISYWLAGIMVLLSGVSANQLRTSHKLRLVAPIAALVSFAIIVYPLAVAHVNGLAEELDNRAAYEEVLEFADLHEDSLFFVDASTANYGMEVSWNEPLEAGSHSNLVWLGGWYTNSPTAIDQWHSCGVDNPFRSLGSLDNAYIIDRYKHVATIAEYTSEQYGARMHYTEVYSSGPYRVYKIKH